MWANIDRERVLDAVYDAMNNSYHHNQKIVKSYSRKIFQNMVKNYRRCPCLNEKPTRYDAKLKAQLFNTTVSQDYKKLDHLYSDILKINTTHIGIDRETFNLILKYTNKI